MASGEGWGLESSRRKISLKLKFYEDQRYFLAIEILVRAGFV